MDEIRADPSAERMSLFGTWFLPTRPLDILQDGKPHPEINSRQKSDWPINCLSAVDLSISNHEGEMKVRRAIVALSCYAVLIALCPGLAVAQQKVAKQERIPVLNAGKWGLFTAPVFGTHETGAYRGAELLPGPNKFGTYFAGVLPNGRIVKPAGISVQVGMNPLGVVLTPDGKYLISSNDDGDSTGFQSYQNPSMNVGGYSLSVIDTASMKVVSTFPSATAAGNCFFIGLQATGTGPYTLWASGGADNNLKIFNISTTGAISAGNPANIPISPITPGDQGFASNYVTAPNAVFPTTPWGFNRNGGAQATFPAGCA